ncbi:uncharacterized protein STEHIDRAFT_171126 [Stereum hirsutum FP-91666 SS1]|uniref:uncharacterized protein n=1 Tax=Stereum hirsutum (strain FP-91666) TaxID=721885 RepID=UPI000444997C|nr:uncharacterized protein STEHIDRAFT_171126 [Stereum hirsutum FP-91666 SS1]EIM83012.1 hypothetical protein STEHIDRAFT_171126 [Stereum hirsutum FP-91666 SS1]
MSVQQDRVLQISGNIPGVLDPTQTSRLLRIPTATLSFAAFDPRAATTDSGLGFPSISLNEELYRPKRVVIESLPDGRSFWRFVPRAKWEPDVEDEGDWPRIIDICGDLVECSRDQWDIYKLDPQYECLVRTPPHLTVISKKPPQKPPVQSESSQTTTIPSNASSTTNPLHSKRRLSASPSPPPVAGPSTSAPREAKRRRQDVATSEESESESDSESEEEEEDEVEAMMVDSSQRPRSKVKTIPSSSKPSMSARQKSGAAADERRRALQQKMSKLRAQSAAPEPQSNGFARASEYVNPPPFQPQPATSTSQASPTKRKGAPSSPPHGTSRSPEPEDYPRFKRQRTLSPDRRGASEKMKRRERTRADEMAKRFNARKEHRNRQFMDEILDGIPEYVPASDGTSHEQGKPPEPPSEDDSKDSKAKDSDTDEDAAVRPAAIEESRRKLAELEKDRDIWERATRDRQLREQEEEEARQRKRRREDAERRAAVEREQEEIRRRLEREKREYAQTQRREQEERTRKRNERWARGPWTPQRALERYKAVCDTFDTTKFSSSEPLTFDTVPWPTLISPVTLTVEDVEWGTVEKFFESVRSHMACNEYKVLVEKSHRRFHPDRWSSRRLLHTVADETERSSLEVAANTVAQALTPLWRKLKEQ